MYVHWLYLSACLLKTSCCSPISIILKIMCLKQALSMPKSPLTAARNAFYSVNIQWTFNYNLCASSGLWHHEGDPWGGACPDQWGVQEAGRVPGRIGTGLARSVPRHIPVSSSHRLKTGLSTDITAHLQTPPVLQPLTCWLSISALLNLLSNGFFLGGCVCHLLLCRRVSDQLAGIKQKKPEYFSPYIWARQRDDRHCSLLNIKFLCNAIKVASLSRSFSNTEFKK